MVERGVLEVKQDVAKLCSRQQAGPMAVRRFRFGLVVRSFENIAPTLFASDEAIGCPLTVATDLT